MNDATMNGVLSTDESTSIKGHRPLISPLLTIIVVTWLGTSAAAHNQSAR